MEATLSAIDDLRLALTNMSERADNMDLDEARKNLRRSREIAVKFTRTNGELARRVVLIITDAQQLVHKSPSIPNYLRYVAYECLAVLDAPATSDS
jgi:hypothetical protein